jgi:hypothetical protein
MAIALAMLHVGDSPGDAEAMEELGEFSTSAPSSVPASIESPGAVGAEGDDMASFFQARRQQKGGEKAAQVEEEDAAGEDVSQDGQDMAAFFRARREQRAADENAKGTADELPSTPAETQVVSRRNRPIRGKVVV